MFYLNRQRYYRDVNQLAHIKSKINVIVCLVLCLTALAWVFGVSHLKEPALLVGIWQGLATPE